MIVFVDFMVIGSMRAERNSRPLVGFGVFNDNTIKGLTCLHEIMIRNSIYTARKTVICTGREPPVCTGCPPGTAWPVLSAPSLSTGQAARY